MTNKILVIAGSDSCGGAGIQADIKTATSLKTYCATAVTCLTAQNSQMVYDIFYPPASFLTKQIEVILSDIKIDVIKIGMLGSAEIIQAVAKILKQKAKNIPIVIDPVMVATSGNNLLELCSLESLKTNLIANSYLITPNIFEAEILSGNKIDDLKDIKIAARKIKNIGVKNVLIKGGHLNDGNKIFHYLLSASGSEQFFSSQRLPFEKVRGTGCTLATAISCFLSQNLLLKNSIIKANKFTYIAIKNSQKIGEGSRILKYC
jgi:hydroxymethylpyrimidine/phosphomethylpyrimidine kinase